MKKILIYLIALISLSAFGAEPFSFSPHLRGGPAKLKINNFSKLIDCTLTVSIENEGESTSESISLVYNEAVLANFKASYEVNSEKQLEALTIVLPSGASVSAQSSLHLSVKTENGESATLVCKEER